MKSIWKSKLVSVIIIFTLLFTSIPSMAFAETTDNSTEPVEQKVSDVKEEVAETDTSLEDILALEDDVSEENFIEEESTEDMSVFQLEGNMKKAIFYSDAVRYEDEDGNLCDYQPELVETTAEMGTAMKIKPATANSTCRKHLQKMLRCFLKKTNIG